MNPSSPAALRRARAGDVDELLALWTLLFDETPQEADGWRDQARAWFDRVVDDVGSACCAVVQGDGRLVACAVGTLELGVPNPHCPGGRAVRLAHLITLPGHRRRGYGTALVEFVVTWARDIRADRVDLSATPAGQGIYARSGFVLASAPRMKLVL